MNNDDKKEKSEEIFFNNLFEKKEKEVNEQLYKNEFYVLEEEMKTNKEQNSLQFMHDTLLNKLMLEDYSPFPPKNEEPTIVNNQKDEKKKEDEQDKLIEEENEFLRSLHRINYLTFSPFGLSFFDDISKDSPSLNEEYYKEREEKILNMIDFDYNNFDVTNDLLLNICQGFVDINKLKEENLICNKTQNNSNNTTNKNIFSHPTNLKNNVGSISIKEKFEPEKDEEELSEEEFYNDLNQKRKIDFYKDIIKTYDEEMNNLNKEEKRNNIKKWKQMLKDKEKDYEENLKIEKENEKKRKEEEKKLKEIEEKKKKEKEEKLKTQNELKKGLEEIVQKARKKGILNKGNCNSTTKIKRKPRNYLGYSPKKTLNNSMMSGNFGEASFISKANLNKSNVSMFSRRKKRFSSKKIK